MTDARGKGWGAENGRIVGFPSYLDSILIIPSAGQATFSIKSLCSNAPMTRTDFFDFNALALTPCDRQRDILCNISDFES